MARQLVSNHYAAKVLHFLVQHTLYLLLPSGSSMDVAHQAGGVSGSDITIRTPVGMRLQNYNVCHSVIESWGFYV